MTAASAGCTPEEMMLVAGARQIRDGEVVFIGMRLPLLCFAVAKELSAPSAVGLFESGLIRDAAPAGAISTMCDLPNQRGALFLGGLVEVMAHLQRGRVDLGFLGAGEIDRHGNLNSSWVGDGERRTRLPGSGGACDIAALSRRVVVVLREEPRRFRERVTYLTSPGHGDGPDWRERVGLPPGGPVRVITQRAVYCFPPATRRLTVETVHPGVDPAELAFPADRGQRPEVTPPPTRAELETVRRFDGRLGR